MNCVKFGYKACVIFLAILQLAIAISLMAAGIYVFASFGDIKQFAQTTYTLVPASIMIAAGVILLLLSAIGFFGACKENKCVLSIFFVLSGALFIIEMVGACLALAMNGTFDTKVRDDFENYLQHYNETAPQEEINWIQETFHCCGSNNYTDWIDLNVMPLPDSCCNNKTLGANNCTVDYVLENKIPGCSSKLHNMLFDNMSIIGGVGLAFALIQLFALVAVLCLLCRRQEHYEVF